MTLPRLDKRLRLVRTAADLVHRQGFERTTLANIAQHAAVPLGNVYYYFKTKEAIGYAIVEQRAAEYRAFLRELSEIPDPKDRLDGFIRMTFDNRKTLARSGCPVGTLCTELHKERGALARNSTRLFAETLAWIEAQFRAIGFGTGSRGFAVHFLAALQGASLLTHSFGECKYIATEAQGLRKWIRGLRPGASVDTGGRRSGSQNVRRRTAR